MILLENELEQIQKKRGKTRERKNKKIERVIKSSRMAFAYWFDFLIVVGARFLKQLILKFLTKRRRKERKNKNVVSTLKIKIDDAETGGDAPWLITIYCM